LFDSFLPQAWPNGAILALNPRLEISPLRSLTFDSTAGMNV
jgi:hypothetical protein